MSDREYNQELQKLDEEASAVREAILRGVMARGGKHGASKKLSDKISNMVPSKKAD
jgi:hypothetical protein